MTQRIQHPSHPRVTFFAKPQPVAASRESAAISPGHPAIAIYFTPVREGGRDAVATRCRVLINNRPKHQGDYKSIPAALAAAVTTVNAELTALKYPEQLTLL